MKAIHAKLERISVLVTRWAGGSWAFAAGVSLIVLWASAGLFVGFTETWLLLVNTATTIITFLMVLLIQRSQNKESQAVQIKLNELLASQLGASNRLINAEDLSEDEIRQLHQRFSKLSDKLQSREDGESHSIAHHPLEDGE